MKAAVRVSRAARRRDLFDSFSDLLDSILSRIFLFDRFVYGWNGFDFISCVCLSRGLIWVWIDAVVLIQSRFSTDLENPRYMFGVQEEIYLISDRIGVGRNKKKRGRNFASLLLG